MIHPNQSKTVVMLKPQSVTAAATVTGRVDRLGYDYACIDVVLDSEVASNSPPTTLKLSESDDTTTTVTDIVAFTGGTAVDATHGFTIPATDSQSVTIVRFNIDLTKRKRYIKITCAAASTQLLSATANLYRAGQSPQTDAIAVGNAQSPNGIRVFG